MGIEPTRVIHSLDFESSASTSSATLALFKAVREKGLEPSRLTALVPKTSVYTNFTTLALQNKNIRGFNFNKNYISRYFCCNFSTIFIFVYRFKPMQFDLSRFANFLSWVISPVVVAPIAYYAIVTRGYGDDANSISYLMVLFFASTLAPIFLISGLKKIGKISDFNISFREQRFLPLLVLVAVNALGYEFMKHLHPPKLLTGILLFNAVNTVFILLITLQWKISIHLFTFTSSLALLFMQFGSVSLWLLPLVPLLMWSRIFLKAHNFMQTLIGGIVGFTVMYAELKWWTGL